MRMTRSQGMVLLGIWLIIINLPQVLSISIPRIGAVVARSHLTSLYTRRLTSLPGRPHLKAADMVVV